MSMEYRKVAVLDTNVLHYVALYLKHAEDGSMYPFVNAKMDAENGVSSNRCG